MRLSAFVAAYSSPVCKPLCMCGCLSVLRVSICEPFSRDGCLFVVILFVQLPFYQPLCLLFFCEPFRAARLFATFHLSPSRFAVKLSFRKFYICLFLRKPLNISARWLTSAIHCLWNCLSDAGLTVPLSFCEPVR